MITRYRIPSAPARISILEHGLELAKRDQSESIEIRRLQDELRLYNKRITKKTGIVEKVVNRHSVRWRSVTGEWHNRVRTVHATHEDAEAYAINYYKAKVRAIQEKIKVLREG